MPILQAHLKKILGIMMAIVAVLPVVVFAADGGVLWEKEVVPSAVPGMSVAEVIAVDSTGVYVGTTGANTVNSAATSLEKRDLIDGHLIWTKSVADGIQTVEVDGTGVYTMTARCTIPNVFPMICDGVMSIVWQKWNKDTGASIKTTLISDTSYPNIPAPYSGASAIDGTGIYVGGQILKVGAGEWAYAKLDLNDGHLIWSTRGNAVSTCAKQADFLGDIAIDGTYLYGVGLIGNELWGTCKQTKIEKRNLSTGAFVAESLGPKSTSWTTASYDEGIWGNVEVISSYIYVSGLLGRGSPVTTQSIIQKRSTASIGTVSWELNGDGNSIAVDAVDPAGILYVFDAGPYGVITSGSKSSYRKYDTNKNLLFTSPLDTSMFSVYHAEFKDGYYYRAGWRQSYWNSFADYRDDWRVEKRGMTSSVDCSADITLGTQKWASCNATQNPQYWYSGVSATAADANGWPYGALYDVNVNGIANGDGSESGGRGKACSAGYHVPSWTEWQQALKTLGVNVVIGPIGSDGGVDGYAVLRNALKLPYPGNYNWQESGQYNDIDNGGMYWADNGTGFSLLGMTQPTVRFGSNLGGANDGFWYTWVGAGLPIRCIADTVVTPPPAPVCVPSTEGWATKTPMPSPVGNPASAVVNGKVYIIGGQKSGVISPKIQVYDPVANSWTTKASSMITPREMAVAAVVNNKIYVIGGDTSLTAVNANEVYDPATDTWAAVAPILTGRVGAGVGVVNNKIYVLGGMTTTAPGGVPVPSTEVYDPTTNAWTTKASMPTPRFVAFSGVVNDKIYAIGGSTNSTWNKDNEVYDPATNTWAIKAAWPDAGTYPVDGGAANSKIYIFGGSFGWPAKNYEYDPATNIWKAMIAPPNSLWGRMGSGVVNNTIYLMNGLLLAANRNDEYTPPNVCAPVSSSTLKICQTSCNSLITRGKGGATTNFAMAQGTSQDLVACYNTVPTDDPLINPCSDASGKVTADWVENSPSGGAISLATVVATTRDGKPYGFLRKLLSSTAVAAFADTMRVTGNSAGTESFAATYSGITATMDTSVTCISVEPACVSADAQNTCTGQQYTMSYTDTCTSLTATKQCDGTRYCDFNWREVAP